MMVEISETDELKKRIRSLRDSVAKAKIASRIQGLKYGNPGDVKPVGEGVSEMRIDRGPGYWVCFVNQQHDHRDPVGGQQDNSAERH